ncbi:MAG: DEAD/DEAH box helicase family protein [Lachnospiraceae bacterium]|nr:DEAD/DEAH box helicase family protein [Lachnospiraceae bacterium]
MVSIKEKLYFQGTWRSYQKRVLDKSDIYLKDKRIHIVAAPGSGKTTLGIELIRRIGSPCLVLSPSITIRDQWISRIEDAFIKGETEEGLLSNNIKKPGAITAITYQALHSCMRQYKGTLEEEETENVSEEVDFSGFDFFKTLEETGIKTICLDEAHHLRSEWWKALEDMMKQLKDVTVISLTATPPYDSTPAQWERYISLCGPIDEEIIVPELVKEGSLCPHQDYVYFNMPTKEEEAEVTKFRQESLKAAEEIYDNPEFARIISSHKGLHNPDAYADKLLENPAFLSSMLIFLQDKRIPFSKELTKLLGTNRKLPKMDLSWMEILLQGFLYEDLESFDCTKEYREQLIDTLKSHSLIHKNKVTLVKNDTINKLLTTSKGKINSIVKITEAEYENLQADLRLLILTDYIKKEHLSAIGQEGKTVNELGVVPIFENIRRRCENREELRLGMLSGSVVVIPKEAKEPMEQMISEAGVKASFKDLLVEGYEQVTVSGTEQTAATFVTKLFNQGYIRVLIGTKSLLGEGWDSPCINSLILASFVGSFMLSNQMRGRAIRTMKDNPDKISNIWHLICMEPEQNQSIKERLLGPEMSEDFQTLKRRFEGFLGVHYEKDRIENGLDRLSIIKAPYTREHVEEMNRQMLQKAQNRQELRQRWNSALTSLSKMEIANEVSQETKQLKPGIRLTSAIIKAALLAVLFFIVAIGIGKFGAGSRNGFVGFLCGVASIAILVPFMGQVMKISKMASPDKYMKSIGNGILSALKELKAIESRGAKVKVEKRDTFSCQAYLEGGTEREKDVFAQSLSEFFAVVDNQRYLLKAKGNTPEVSAYYCVPELFGKRKEDGELFLKHLEKAIGKYELIYTRNGEGRKILLEARVKSLANKSTKSSSRKKTVKSPFQ